MNNTCPGHAAWDPQSTPGGEGGGACWSGPLGGVQGTPMARGQSTKIISMIKWTRTSRLSIKNFLAHEEAHFPRTLEREIFIDNLLVRVHLIIERSRPALRHGSLNFLFHVALYLPS